MTDDLLAPQGADAVFDPPTISIHTPPVTPIRRGRGRPRKERPNIEPETSKATVPGIPPESTTRRAHALDFAPVGSKIVVTNAGAVLATPDQSPFLPDGDEAHKLPVGARIAKVAEGKFQSEQLNPSVDHASTIHASAVEAIGAFTAYFHG